MARLVYECNSGLRSNINSNETASGPFTCTPDRQYCCNSQCCLLVQRRPPRHLWEAWYFWFGLALLVLFLVTSVSSYLVSTCKHNFQMASFGINQSGLNNVEGNQNEISINVIANGSALPSHTKMLLTAPRASLSHMTPIVA